MTLSYGLQTIVNNTGVSIEWTILLLVIIGAIIYAAKSFQMSMIILLATSGGLFMWYYQIGWNWILPLATFFLALVLLTLTLFSTNSTSTTGGFV